MKNVLDEIKTLLAATFTTTFKHYVIGAGYIQTIPESSCPALIISGNATTIENSGTVKDKNTYRIQIKIVDNAKRYIDNTNGEWAQQELAVQHYKWMEDRDTTTQALKAATIMGIIRDNIDLGETVLFTNNLSVEYTPDPDGTTFVSTLTFDAEHRTTR